MTLKEQQAFVDKLLDQPKNKRIKILLRGTKKEIALMLAEEEDDAARDDRRDKEIISESL